MWKVLLVDDEESIRKLLSAVLEMADYSVEIAGSARSAIDVLRSKSFDAVVTDLRMETPLAGYDVAQFAARLNPRPFVAIVTAFPVPAQEWRRVGADALFTKGTDTLQLATRLNQMLEARKAHLPKAAERSRDTVRRRLS
jgi:CheY-like chemotaxis protein